MMSRIGFALVLCGLPAAGRATAQVPVARSDSYRLPFNAPFSVDAAHGVLANDSGPPPLTAVLALPPSRGTLALKADGSLVYTPAPGYSGPDAFVYKVSSGGGESVVAIVNLEVFVPPAAADDYYRLPSDAIFSVEAARGVLANDAGPGPYSPSVVAAPAHGDAVLKADGSLAYTPRPGYHGPDAFTYRALAGDGPANNVAIVSLQVVAPPVVVDDAYKIPGGKAFGRAEGVLANDYDVNGPERPGGPPLPMLASVVTGPARGTLKLLPDGAFEYIADAGYSGTDSFTYRASNGVATSKPATVTLTVKRNP
jgi:hypothetical protein